MSNIYEKQLAAESFFINKISPSFSRNGFYPELDEESGEPITLFEEETYGFDQVEDAVFSLYENLFHSQKINKEDAYKAMRYLTWRLTMGNTYEEIKELDELDITA